MTKAEHTPKPPATARVVTAGRARVIVVDDERAMLIAVRRILGNERFDVVTFDDPAAAIAHAASHEVDVMLVDQRMPGMSGVEVMGKLKELRPDAEVVLMTAYATIESAIAAVRAGAFDFITKPFENIDKVTLTVEKAFERCSLVRRARDLEQQLAARSSSSSIVGTSRSMADVFRLVDTVAPTSANVLIRGETGTGKELVANALHERSPRAHERLVTVNCSALTETLLESELFGHLKGSFTGATQNKKGLFEAAHRGTLFLDEVGDLPPATQVKLLRALQQGEVKPIGSNDVVHVDVRVIAATHIDLEEALRRGTFREDLYWRLNVIAIRLPPLRERIEDVPMLVAHFLRTASARFSRKVQSVSADVMATMMAHRWDGNVRELENVVERAVVLCDGDVVEMRHLPEHLRPVLAQQHAEPVFGPLAFRDAKDRAVEAFERSYLESLLATVNGNVSEAARFAGLDRSNFRGLLVKHALAPEHFKP